MRLLITTIRREVSPFALDCGLWFGRIAVHCWMFGSLESAFLCLNIGLMGLSIAEQPFGGDAGLHGERTNLHLPFGG